MNTQNMIDLGNNSYIGSALGGVGQSMRYYLILYHYTSDVIDDGLTTYIKQCLINPKRILESVDINTDCLVLCVLIHMDYALDDVVMQHINLINQHGPCLLRGYGAINTAYPSQEFINSTRQHLRSQYQQGLL